MNVDISLGDNSNFWRFANVTHVIEISVILIFSNRLPHVIGTSPGKKYQASISFNFSINISKRMSKMKGQSKSFNKHAQRRQWKVQLYGTDIHC